MAEVFNPPQAPPFASWLQSTALHLALAGALWYGARELSSAPRGVYRKGDPTIVEISLGVGGPFAPEAADEVAVRNAAPDAADGVALARKKLKKKEAKLAKPAPPAPPAARAASANTPGPGTAEGKFGHAEGVQAAGPLGVANGRDADALERYLYELRVLIEGRKTYPFASRQMREAGRVTLRFEILKDGTIRGVQVAEGSPYARLNEAARQLVASLGSFRPLPAGHAEESLPVDLPILYRLDR